MVFWLFERGEEEEKRRRLRKLKGPVVALEKKIDHPSSRRAGDRSLFCSLFISRIRTIRSPSSPTASSKDARERDIEATRTLAFESGLETAALGNGIRAICSCSFFALALPFSLARFNRARERGRARVDEESRELPRRSFRSSPSLSSLLHQSPFSPLQTQPVAHSNVNQILPKQRPCAGRQRRPVFLGGN